MRVIFPQKLFTSFKRRASKSFPNEAFAFLIGRRDDPETVNIKDLFYPIQEATPSQVSVPQEGMTQAMEYAAQKKLICVGTCHSHPYPYRQFKGVGMEPLLSIGDIDSWESTDLIAGVCSVIENKSGKKTFSLAFWMKPHLCEVVQ